MNAVTTGQGVSGTLSDQLETLVATLRTDTGDSRWRLHLQLIQLPAYTLRVYAPDRHSHEHMVRMTLNTVKDIRDILASEARLWESRVRPDGDRQTV